MNIAANITTLIMGLITVCAVFSSVLVAIINNRHARKMKELEIKAHKELEAIRYMKTICEGYLKSTSRYLAHSSSETERLYGENYSISFVYFPADVHASLKSINSHILKDDFDKAIAELEVLSASLSQFMAKTLT